jgi:cell shape-determining protein MreC
VSRESPHIGSRTWLIAVALLLVCASVLPARYSEWVAKPGDLAARLIAPASHPISMVARWFVPAERGRRNDRVQAAAEQEREYFRMLWHREQQENERLRRIIQELQQGVRHADLPVRRVMRPVIGTSSDGAGGLLKVLAGTVQGIEKNAVATTAGVQLVGRTIDARSRLSHIRLITDSRSRERIRGVIMTAEDARGSICLLHPIGDGRLQGQVESGTDRTPAEVGQLVRLDDEEWPRHSQMLVIGRIERVERGTHGWQFIVVRPTVDLERVKEVVLLFTPDLETAGADERGLQ